MGSLRRLHRDEAGVGLVLQLTSFLVVLMMMMTSVHVLANLYAHSTVRAVAYEAARIASAEDGTEAMARAHIATAMGPVLTSPPVIGGSAELVTVTLTARGPSLVPAGVPDFGLREITVTATARREAFQP